MLEVPYSIRLEITQENLKILIKPATVRRLVPRFSQSLNSLMQPGVKLYNLISTQQFDVYSCITRWSVAFNSASISASKLLNFESVTQLKLVAS